MQTFFIAIYFCFAGSCGVGWVNQPLQGEDTCNAYSQLYSQEIQKRAPESSGEIYCVPESLLGEAIEKFEMVEMKTLEELTSLKD